MPRALAPLQLPREASSPSEGWKLCWSHSTSGARPCPRSSPGHTAGSQSGALAQAQTSGYHIYPVELHLRADFWLLLGLEASDPGKPSQGPRSHGPGGGVPWRAREDCTLDGELPSWLDVGGGAGGLARGVLQAMKPSA